MVEREPYNLLFGERKGPDGTQLGRPPGGGQAAARIFQQLIEAEPHATAERRRELLIEAVGRARRSPLYFDLTISLSKSISIFHASLGENVRLARLAGDKDGAQYWAGLSCPARRLPQDLLVVPGCPRQQMLQLMRPAVPGRLGDRPAVVVLQFHQQPADHLGGVLTGFPAREAAGDLSQQFS